MWIRFICNVSCGETSLTDKLYLKKATVNFINALLLRSSTQPLTGEALGLTATHRTLAVHRRWREWSKDVSGTIR